MAFPNPVIDGNGAIVVPAIKSPNYVPGVSGWAIFSDGTSEFNEGSFRGDLEIGTPPQQIIFRTSGVAGEATELFTSATFPENYGAGNAMGYLTAIDNTGAGRGAVNLVSQSRGAHTAQISLASDGTNVATDPCQASLAADVLAGFNATGTLGGDIPVLWGAIGFLAGAAALPARTILLQAGTRTLVLNGGTSSFFWPQTPFPRGLLTVLLTNGDPTAFTGRLDALTPDLNGTGVKGVTLAGGVPANGTNVRVNFLAIGW